MEAIVPDDLPALVAQARDGDPDAWEAMYCYVQPALLSFARRRMPSRELAEDAVSETMVRALTAIDRFVWRGGGVEAWLFGILRNVVCEMNRDASRSCAGPVPDVISDEPEPIDALVRADEVVAVRDALALLRADERELLDLRFAAGLDTEAAAAVLGKRRGAVRMAQWRALVRLRRHLADDAD